MARGIRENEHGGFELNADQERLVHIEKTASQRRQPCEAMTPQEGIGMNIGIIAQHADIRHWLETHAEVVASVQPAWADPALTWVDLDFSGREAASVRFVGHVAGIEASQWCDVENDTLTLRGEPRIGSIPNDLMDALTLIELRRLASLAGTSLSEMYETLLEEAA